MNIKPTPVPIVVIFGIFDVIHEGHRHFLREARAYGGRLIAVVGRDGAAVELKNQRPRYPEELRVARLREEPGVDEALLGDIELSSYRVLEDLEPDLICLGYDQLELGKDLMRWMRRKGKELPVRYLSPYQPKKLHTSLIRAPDVHED